MKDRILKPSNGAGHNFTVMPPVGSKVRKEIDQREFEAREELSEALARAERLSDPKQIEADKALEQFLKRVNNGNECK